MSTDFGRDTSCTDTLHTGRYATGVQLVAEACYRRLITPRGMLRGGEEEANYGLDLAGLIGSTSTDSDLASLPGRIENELEKDERVNSATVTIAKTVDAAKAVSFTITVEAQTDAGPFALVLKVSDVTVEILGITSEAA